MFFLIPIKNLSYLIIFFYHTVHFLKVFYNFDKLFSSKGNIFVGMNNLFNRHYAETIFGTNMYSASPTFNVTAGVNYSF